jgi:hypothetical protein
MSHDDDDELWGPTEADAHNTTCPTCDAAYEVVRPGKIQPSCSCHVMADQQARIASLEKELQFFQQECSSLIGFCPEELLDLWRVLRDENLTNCPHCQAVLKADGVSYSDNMYESGGRYFTPTYQFAFECVTCHKNVVSDRGYGIMASKDFASHIQSLIKAKKDKPDDE